jgi:hypothetical protein
MSLRKIRIICQALALLFVGGAGAILYWSMTTVCEVDISRLTIAAPPKPISETNGKQASPEQLKVDTLFDRQFQRPLFDPPPPPPPPPVEKPKPTPPALRVLATMIEPTGNQAMLADSRGATHMVRVGAQLGEGTSNSEVLEITASGVVLKHRGELFTMQLNQ